MSTSIEIRIYNPALELKGIIDEFSSLLWIRRYQSPGEFELKTPYAAESKSLLVPGNILQRYDGAEVMEAAVIERLNMNEDTITVKGRFLESYLDRRLIKDTTYYYGKAETSMRKIISNMVEIPLLQLGAEQGLSERLEYQATYKPVLNIIQKVCKRTTLGFRIRPDFSARTLFFEVYKGEDRTSSTAAKVIFSEKYDNLFNEEYNYDGTDYKSKAYVSQLIDDIRTVYTVGGGTGLDLYEVHVSTQVDTNGRTAAEIKESMESQGEKALSSRTVNESFSFSTDANSPFTYRKDYDIGDLVHVKHIAWGIDLALRITEIEEAFENGGREIYLTCGSPLPEILDFEED